ncbi:MAG TPA: FHA domain-containing protein [Myxococcales bacterium]|nr:FHA domain-containing protein [Myxococcales bacterium]HIN85227.1 FHA domain-containing protein [Myxococcales bacterium]
MLKLHIQDDVGKITVVPVIRDEISIGRKEGMTIRLTDRNVSREHACLRKTDGNLYIHELSARFGTKVNGGKVDGSMELLAGDVVQIGDYLLSLHSETGEEVTDPGYSTKPTASVSDTGEFGPVPLETQIIEVAEPVVDIPTSEQARLVVISRNLGGQETHITHSPFSIGRTNDNDFQLDHRSISRNHIVVRHDSASYSVSDLDSANGIRINGDEYRKADLHPGDEIEMGHILIRFVGADENFVSSDQPYGAGDLLVADVAPSRAGKVAMIGILLLAITAAAAWVLHFSKQTEPVSGRRVIDSGPIAKIDPVNQDNSKAKSGGIIAKANTATKSEESTPEEADTVAKAETQETKIEPVVAKTVTPIKAASTKGKKSSETKNKAAKNKGPNNAAKALAHLTAARQLLREGNHAAAEQAAKSALKVDSRATEAKAILRTVRNERRGNAALSKAMKAKQYGNWKKVLAHARKGLRYDASSTVREALSNLENEARRQLASAKNKASNTNTNKDNASTKTKLSGGSKLEVARELAKQAKTAKRASNLTLAEALYRQCLKTHSGMQSCRADLAVILMARGKRCEALRHMRRYVKSHPGSGKAVQFKRLIEQFEPQCN